MNIQERDVLKELLAKPFANQRLLAEQCGHSLGVVNQSVRKLTEAGYLDEHLQPTATAKELLDKCAPESAVILAAGLGMRMVPIHLSTPKALLEVKGQSLIERLILQLQEAGVRNISVVVGFMKEKFEYLIDEYGVDLVVNTAYAEKNNLHSLALVADRLSNSYIVPSDIWCEENPFSHHELYSWYMVTEEKTLASDVKVNRRQELVKVSAKEAGNALIGISYLLKEDAARLKNVLQKMDGDPDWDEAFWEAALFSKKELCIAANIVLPDSVVEVNTYQQLRELDGSSQHLESAAMQAICSALHTSPREIVDIEVTKKGMTNRSFCFAVNRVKYIMRVPGEGTDRLINRRQEADVYRTIAGRGLCDAPVLIDPESGFKITRFLEGIRTADSNSDADVALCMRKLRAFHEMNLQVDHEFDIFGQIDFYESLLDGVPSIYRDYQKTKARVWALRSYIEAHRERSTLTHIDAVPDNFLFCQNEQGERELQLTDWEYAGMQDPHVDIAMFGIYSLYSKEQMDRLIDFYFEGSCNRDVRIKIYCYIAACGLLWSNWCEYKQQLGVEFGEYALRQYRYAKEYCKYAEEEMKELCIR